jgi:hypothetical protein
LVAKGAVGSFAVVVRDPPSTLASTVADDVHGRIVLDVEWGPKAGGEARTAMVRFTRLAGHVDGAHGVIYDTALRGVHHQTLLRELGLLPINRVAAAKANPKNPRRAERRVEKSAYVEEKVITVAGREVTLAIYARGGAIGIGELAETGDVTFTELPRIRTHRNGDKNGKYRWYNDYQLPQIRTSPGYTPAATTPNRSTGISKTPSGSDAPIASATPANTSTSSATPSWSTASPYTVTSGAVPSSPPRAARANNSKRAGRRLRRVENTAEVAVAAPTRPQPALRRWDHSPRQMPPAGSAGFLPSILQPPPS